MNQLPQIKVYYDDQCMFCRSLAAYMSRKAPKNWLFLPSSHEKYRTNPLTVSYNQQKFIDEEAWNFIIEQHPTFGTYNWLAKKIGLKAEAKTVIRRISKGVGRACKSCQSIYHRSKSRNI